jgi:integrase
MQSDSNAGTSDAQQEHQWNPYHQRLLDVLRQEHRSQITVRELCRKAGVGRNTCYKALKDPHFVAAVSTIGIKVGVLGVRYQQEPTWIPTPQEQKLLNVLDILHLEGQKHILVLDLCRKAIVSKSIWYEAMKKPPFVAEVEVRGVKVGKTKLSGHLEVCLATDPEEELAKDIWDMRRLKPDYPKHMPPAAFKVDFACIGNSVLRQQVKGYFRIHLPRWKPKTFQAVLNNIKPFFRFLPSDVHIGTLNRTVVESLLPQIYQLSAYSALMCLRRTRDMLDYMASSPNWVDMRPPRFLLLDEDIPSETHTLPRPIPADVLYQFDTLLEQAIQAMETAQQPPLLKASYWNALLILRRTGMRFEDLAHLKAPDDAGRNGCLHQDSEGFWWIHLHHKINKASRDHMIPTRMSDGVIAAVHRQRELIKDIPNHFDESYLFRDQKGVLTQASFQGALAKKLAPQLLHEGQPYVITPHQFRHTIATDMIDQGIDIHTVKEFRQYTELCVVRPLTSERVA